MKQIYFYAILIPFVISCTTIYQPSSVVAPILDKKGDMELQATFRKASVNPKGATLNLGYCIALSDKYAAIIKTEYQYEGRDQMHHNYNRSKNISGEVYAGRYFSNEVNNTGFYLGFGRGRQEKSASNGDYNSDYVVASALFNQTWKRSISGSGSGAYFTYFLRVNYIHNYNIYYNTEMFSSYENMFAIEPGANYLIQIGKCDLFIQAILAHNPFDLTDGHKDYYTARPVVLIGMRLNLNYKP